MTRSTHLSDQPLADLIAAARVMLLRKVRRILRNREEAEDVAQDALLLALCNRHHYRGDAQLTTWLYRVGVNAALMAMRRQRQSTARTARALLMLSPESNWLYGAKGDLLPSQKLEQAHSAQRLHFAIAHLPARYRAVVTECDLGENPIPEVARSLGLTSAGVRTRRLRAIHLLRARLDSPGHRMWHKSSS